MKDKFNELKEAHRNGARIEYRNHSSGLWFPATTPAWDINLEYRIDPNCEYAKVIDYKIKEAEKELIDHFVKGASKLICLNLINNMNQQTPERSRPIREWLNELPEPYRTQALVNAALNKNNRLNDPAKSDIEALEKAFIWADSSQLHDHWKSFCNDLMKKSLIPSKEEYPGMVTAYPNDKRFQELARLMWLRDETWRRDGNWKPDWADSEQNKFVGYFSKEKLTGASFYTMRHPLAFRTQEVYNQFVDTHKDLIEECKEFL